MYLRGKLLLRIQLNFLDTLYIYNLKIATWNIERFQKRFQHLILDEIKRVNADIIVLTESSIDMEFDGYFCATTNACIPNLEDIVYEKFKVRTGIYSKYPIVKQHKTYDDYTAICIDM